MNQMLDSRLRSELDDVCNALERTDYLSAQASLDRATDIVLDPSSNLLTGAANFLIWAYASAFVGTDNIKGASILIQREQELHEARHTKVFCDLLHCDLALRGAACLG